MATQWYWRDEDDDNGDIERGPVSFRELVIMVRDEVLDDIDLVRPHYSPNWQEAASVIGLFQMAGRKDLLAKWEEERRLEELSRQESQIASGPADETAGGIGLDDLEGMLSLAGSLPEGEESAWEVRLREVEAQRTLEEQERTEELVAAQFQQQKDEAIAAAVANQESKAALSQSRWGWLAMPGALPRRILEVGFQLCLITVAVSLVAWGVLSWSETEAMRFPDAQATQFQVKPFPLWGPCRPDVYAFLLLDSVILAGVVAFVGSRLLIRLTDD